jgi:hypothetical protein
MFGIGSVSIAMATNEKALFTFLPDDIDRSNA